MKEKGNKLYVKWKGDKLKPKTLGANVKVKLDLSSNATKVEIKKITNVDTSDFAKTTDLANLKSDLDKLDID